MAEKEKPNLTCLALITIFLVLTMLGYMGPIIEGILNILGNFAAIIILAILLFITVSICGSFL